MQDHNEWVMSQQTEEGQHVDHEHQHQQDGEQQQQEEQTYDQQQQVVDEPTEQHDIEPQPYDPEPKTEDIHHQIQEEPQDHGHSHNLTEEAGLLPEWLLLLLHDSSVIDGDRLALVAIISLTLLALHLIKSFITKSS